MKKQNSQIYAYTCKSEDDLLYLIEQFRKHEVQCMDIDCCDVEALMHSICRVTGKWVKDYGPYGGMTYGIKKELKYMPPTFYACINDITNDVTADKWPSVLNFSFTGDDNRTYYRPFYELNAIMYDSVDKFIAKLLDARKEHAKRQQFQRKAEALYSKSNATNFQDYVEGCIDGLIHGNKALWYYAGKAEPDIDKQILVERFDSSSLRHIYNVEIRTESTDWPKHAICTGIIRFAYIEDLLP